MKFLSKNYPLSKALDLACLIFLCLAILLFSFFENLTLKLIIITIAINTKNAMIII